MALLDIALLQANAHGQDLGLWHLRSLGPLLRPLGQMALVKAVRGWDFTPGDSERTSYSLEHKAAGQGSDDGLEQHSALLLFRSPRTKEQCRGAGRPDRPAARRMGPYSLSNLMVLYSSHLQSAHFVMSMISRASWRALHHAQCSLRVRHLPI